MTGTENGLPQFIQAGFGNNNTAIADTSFTSGSHPVTAGFGNDNYAYLDGPANSTAGAGGTADISADNNIAYILDPFGTTSDFAGAGSYTAAGGDDLAAVLFTHGNAVAENSPLLYDIISLFGTATGTL